MTGTTAFFGDLQIVYSPSALDQLLDLMASYFDGTLDAEEWYRRFTVEHLITSRGDPHWSVVMLIEGTLADMDSGVSKISKEECRTRIWHICAAAEIVIGNTLPAQRRFMKITTEYPIKPEPK